MKAIKEANVLEACRVLRRRGVTLAVLAERASLTQRSVLPALQLLEELGVARQYWDGTRTLWSRGPASSPFTRIRIHFSIN